MLFWPQRQFSASRHKHKAWPFLVRWLHAFMIFALMIGALQAQAQENGQSVVVRDLAVYEAMSELSSSEDGIASFYQAREYRPLWTDRRARRARKALLDALEEAAAHGLPAAKYEIEALEAGFKARLNDRERAALELAATRIFLAYAHDMSSGVVRPQAVDREIDIDVRRYADRDMLEAFSKSTPDAFLDALAPNVPQYQALLDEKYRLEKILGQGDWGATVRSQTLRPGDSSAAVTALRARLERMGYGRLGDSPVYDTELTSLIQQFQLSHGLNADGVIGPATLAQINTQAAGRLAQVMANLERLRWLHFPQKGRYIYVNQADFHVYVIDDGRISFKSRTVIGRVDEDRTPEFIDEMTHMVINPTWHVPRSIAGEEYLPLLKQNPGFLAQRNMRLLDLSGKDVNPAGIDFSSYNERNFPFYIKQRPDPGNALGLVKFMFPNQYNIYLHDTPSKSLFNRDIRAFSHGCVRVHQPFDFAYHLLAAQERDPQGVFTRHLNTGKETYVNLEAPVPVYLTYNTAFMDEGGVVRYRGDVYGRDAKIYNALTRAGVEMRALR